MKYQNILEMRKVFGEGKNISQLMAGDPDATEVSYDLQAGSYVEFRKNNLEKVQSFTNEIMPFLASVLESSRPEYILDCGCGELTTSVDIIHALQPKMFIGLDSSLSRLKVGEDEYYRENFAPLALDLVCADMTSIPLADNSVDLAYTVHAIEPNRHTSRQIIKELARVSRNGIVLFEPCYERADEEQALRMHRMGYATDTLRDCRELQGANFLEILDVRDIENSINPKNKTTAIVMKKKGNHELVEAPWADPVDPKQWLVPVAAGDFLASVERGVLYPEIQGIPILKPSAQILCTEITKRVKRGFTSSSTIGL